MNHNNTLLARMLNDQRLAIDYNSVQIIFEIAPQFGITGCLHNKIMILIYYMVQR